MDKVKYVHTLDELSQIIPMEHVQIPECVLQWVLWPPRVAAETVDCLARDVMHCEGTEASSATSPLNAKY